MPLIPIALSLVGQFAPAIIKYFTNSETAAAVAGQVVDIAKTVTGSDTPDGAMAAIQADPVLAVQFQTAVMANDANLEKAHLADRQDARARDVKLAEAGRRNVRADVMVVMDVIGLVACLVVLAFFRSEIPGEVVVLLSSIASIFGLCLRDAHQFEFGSSRSSQTKDVTISNLSR